MTPDRLFRCLNWKVAYSEWGKSRIPMCWKLSCGPSWGRWMLRAFNPGCKHRAQSLHSHQRVVWPQKSQEINESNFWAGGKVTEMNPARKPNSLAVTGCTNLRMVWAQRSCLLHGRKETSTRAGRRCQISSTIAVILPHLQSWSVVF